MKDLKFITTQEINNDICNIQIIDFDQIDSTKVNNTKENINEVELKLIKKEFKLNKTYNDNTNFFKEFIDKVIKIHKINYPDHLKEFKSEGNMKSYKNLRKLTTKFFSCSNYIATNGRIGPAQFAIIPNNYIQYLQLLQINIELIPTNLFDDKIIFGRKNNIVQPGVFLFYNKEIEKYTITDIGSATNQYHILKVISLRKERKEKIKQIKKNLK